MVYLDLTGFYLFLLGFTEFHRALLGFYLVLLGFTGFYWVLPSFTGFYWVLLGFTGFSLGFTWIYLVFLGFTVFYGTFRIGCEIYRVVATFLGVNRALLGFRGSYWSNFTGFDVDDWRRGQRLRGFTARTKHLSSPLVGPRSSLLCFLFTELAGMGCSGAMTSPLPVLPFAQWPSGDVIRGRRPLSRPPQEGRRWSRAEESPCSRPTSESTSETTSKSTS